MSQTHIKQSHQQSPQIDVLIEEQRVTCSNCGVELSGKFCHQCGQSSRSMIKFFGEVIKELVDDVFGYDSRLKHSILPLLFKPGQLTLEYIKGRRFYYVMPFRLYLITSLLFIFALQFIVDPNDMVVSDLDKEAIVENVKEELKNSDLSTEEQLNIIKKIEEPLLSDKDKSDQGFGITINENGARFNGFEVEEEGLLKNVMDEINSKGEGWLKNPKPLIDELFRILPYMMFILLPIFALFQKLLYVFAKHFYIEHLIFSLHNHCFIYTALLLSLGMELSAEKLLSVEHWMAQSTSSLLELMSLLLAVWIILYIVLATKRVYKQGWWLTLGKTFSLGFVYLGLSLSGLFVTIVVGAYRA